MMLIGLKETFPTHCNTSACIWFNETVTVFGHMLLLRNVDQVSLVSPVMADEATTQSTPLSYLITQARFYTCSNPHHVVVTDNCLIGEVGHNGNIALSPYIIFISCHITLLCFRGYLNKICIVLEYTALIGCW